jgi:hypothetical protein
MGRLVGANVFVSRAPVNRSESVDPVFFGVQGLGGGREWPLSVPGNEDFTGPSFSYNYRIGRVPQNYPSGDLITAGAEGRNNSMEVTHIAADLINTVYVRKAIGPTQGSDDPLALERIEVVLFEESADAAMTWSVWYVHILNPKAPLWLGYTTGGFAYLARG